MSRTHTSNALLREYPAVIREIAAHEPRSLPAMLVMLSWCRLRHGLGPRDFFDFRLHAQPLSTWGGYISDLPHMRWVMRSLHPPRLRTLADDKVLSTERWMEHGVPVAPVIAVAGRDMAAYPSGGRIAVINDTAALAHRLDAADIPPSLFCKPAAGTFGRGVFRADRVDGGWKLGDRVVATQALAEHILSMQDPAGTLVMPRLSNHPELAPIVAGDGISATRVYTAVTQSGVEVFCALQKVLTEEGLADNFIDGAAGHLLCPIDPATGRFSAAYGRRPGERFLLRKIERHAATGARFTDFILPHWPQILELAVRASEAMPELPLPGLDIALTPEGPVLLESNAYCYVISPQLQFGPLRPMLERLIPRLRAEEQRLQNALWALRNGGRPPQAASA